MSLPEAPNSNVEKYLSKICGQTSAVPEAPNSRVEQYLDYIAQNGTVSKEEIAEQVSEWLEENIHEDPTVVIDASLSVSGAAADAKATGDEIADLDENINDLKSAVDDVVEHPINLYDDSSYVGGYYIDNNTGASKPYATWGYLTIPIKPGRYYLCAVRNAGTQYEIIDDLYNGYFNGDEFVSGQIVNSSSSAIVVPENANIAKISSHDYMFDGRYFKDLMLVTAEYYDNNVTDIDDYVPHSSTPKIKEAALPYDITKNINTLLRESEFMTIMSGERDVFTDEVTATISSIQEHTDTPSFVMTIVADPHLLLSDTTRVSRTKDTFRNINAVTRYCWSDGLSIIGDMVQGNVAEIMQADVDKTIATIMGWGQYCNTKLFGINGNHDGVGGGIPRTDNYATMLRLNEEYVTRENGKPYFYIDYPHHKIRAIYLCTNQQVGNTHIWGVGNEQLAWFSATLTSTPIDFDAVIFSHIGTFDTNDFKTNRAECCSALNNWIANASGKCIGWYCGHEHLDCIVPPSASGINCPQVVLQCSLMTKWIPTSEYTYIYNLPWVANNREADTVSQDCWTTLCYNKADNKVYLVRFGAGDDMTIDLTQY